MKEDLEEIGRLTSRVFTRCWKDFVPYAEMVLGAILCVWGVVTFSPYGLAVLLVISSTASLAFVKIRPSVSAMLALGSIAYLCAFQALLGYFAVVSSVTTFSVVLMLIVCFSFVRNAPEVSDRRIVQIARAYGSWMVAATGMAISVSLAPEVVDVIRRSTGIRMLQNEALGVFLTILGFGTVFTVAWLAGYVVRVRRERKDAAARQRLTDEQLRQADLELRVTKERDRIAQDVHDIMAHSLSVIVAQSDGARLVRERDPDAVDGALHEIAASARTSLTEVRMLIESLVNSPEGHSHPTLDNADELIERMQSAGLEVTRDEYGEPFALMPTQQLAVYRIVQEALTNALKHAGADPHARVVMDWRGTGLSISIASHGSMATADSGITDGTEAFSRGEESPPGRGLYGMRERARLAGGWLTAGPDEQGYAVSAYIPRQDAADDGATGDSIHSRPDEPDESDTTAPPSSATTVDHLEADSAALAVPDAVDRTVRESDDDNVGNSNRDGERA